MYSKKIEDFVLISSDMFIVARETRFIFILFRDCSHSCLPILFILCAFTYTSYSVLFSIIKVFFLGTFVLYLCSFVPTRNNTSAQRSRPIMNHGITPARRPTPDQ